MSSSWTKGIWTKNGDTVYLHMIPTYDTLTKTNSNGVNSDTIILSDNEISDRITPSQAAAILLSSGGQNRSNYPDKLLFRKGRLYKIHNGKLVTKKQKGFWTAKKWDPWFFRSND